MSEIAIVGKEEFTLGFMLAGVRKIYVDHNLEETKNKLIDFMNDENIGIIVLQQETFNELPVHIQDNLVKSVKPVVVTLSKTADAGKLREMIIKSIGVDLWEK